MRKKETTVRENPQFGERMSFAGIIRGTMYTLVLGALLTGCSKEDPNVLSGVDPLAAAGIAEVFPGNLTDSVAVNPDVSVTFKSGTSPSTVAASTITLKEGTSIVPGKLTYSGTTATFTASADLNPDYNYTATIKTASKGVSGSDDAKEYSWSFRTGRHHNDNVLSVVSVTPLDLASGVVLSVDPVVKFNQYLTLALRNSLAFVLLDGINPVNGSVSYSGNSAIFKPAADLITNKVYTGKVTIGSHESDDHAADKVYTWSFSTGTGGADVTAPKIVSVVPANNATAIPVGNSLSVNFSVPMNSATVTASSFTLKQGTTAIPGTVTYSGSAATFKPASSLTANLVYTATITTDVKDVAGNALAANYTWSFTTAPAVVTDVVAPTIVSVLPANNATAIPVGNSLTVNFSEAMNSATLTAASFTLKQGTTAVTGTVAYSGTAATFKPAASLTANTLYTAVITTAAKDVAGNALAANYTWSFTTASAVVTDVVPPTVLSVVPANSSVSVATGSKATITFSEAMDPTTISASTFTLKIGTMAVSGTVTYSGTTATFTPTQSLAASTVYSASLTTGAKDVAGNAIATAYSWSFTTAAQADVTPPTMSGNSPLNNATSVAVNSVVTATFSESMNSTTISSTSFTLKQGTTSVTGTVSYTGTTATFTPGAALAGNTLYTATITTAAKDMAGNALASNVTWSFTTIVTTPPVTAMSFASDVVPVLNACNACHTHPWTTSAVASTFYANLVSSGYVNAASFTTSKIYVKLNSGHPGSSIPAADITKILTWMSEGSKNN